MPSYASNAQCSGGNVLALIAALGPFHARASKILVSHGIADVQADGWYSLQHFAAALAEIGERLGPATLFQVGARLPELIAMPPGLDEFDTVANAFAHAFELNHRHAGTGGIECRVTGVGAATIVSRTPYPCDFDRGVIQGFFRKLLGRSVVTSHADDAPCKARSGGSCTHVVRSGSTARLRAS